MTNEKAHQLTREAEIGASGAMAGAVIGAVAGPPGAIVGAVVGAAMGAIAGFAIDREMTEKEATVAALDAEIGVSGGEGEMGAPNLEHPPATIGAYSGASSGASSAGGEEPAEGPIPPPSS
jgi:hypothetical protein